MRVGCLAVASHLVMWLICCLVSAQPSSLTWPIPSTTSLKFLPPTPAYCSLCCLPFMVTETPQQLSSLTPAQTPV